VRFATKRYGIKGAAPLKDVVVRVYSRFDGQVGTVRGVDMRFSRAELEGESPVLGRAPVCQEAAGKSSVTLLEIYNATAAEITSTSYQPAWRRTAETPRDDGSADSPGKPRGASVSGGAKDASLSVLHPSEGAGATTMPKRQRITGK